jgi:CRP/FNR family transcriptional regulator, cyclic AMP receptor protein
MRHAPAPSDLERASAFSGLSAKDRARVGRHADIVEVAAGTRLASSVQVLRHVYFVLDGQAIVEDGDRLLAVVDADGIIGLQHAFDRSRPTVTVTAVTDMRLAVLGVGAFNGLLDEIPGLARRILGLHVLGSGAGIA